jgi:hypothetical protein
VASDAKKGDSVFDILYADTRRLSSLLSQFSDDGLVTEVVRGAEEATSTQIGISVKVVKADGTELGKSSVLTKIDPQWLLPLLFLDAAQQMIQRDIEAAPIGSLVLSQGKLIVTDLAMLKEMWKSETARQYMLQKAVVDEEAGLNRQARRAAGKKGHGKEVTDAELAFELLPLLPHSPQINIIDGDRTVWASVDERYMNGSASDVMLKHGVKVAGSWSMVSILDARPFEMRDDEDEYDDHDDILSFSERLAIGMMTDNLWKVANELAAPARQALGRPLLSYGVTPLIIFREIETVPASNRSYSANL